jgi:hypothetical protein
MLSMLFLIISLLAVGDLVNYAAKHHIIPRASLNVYGATMVKLNFCFCSWFLLA